VHQSNFIEQKDESVPLFYKIVQKNIVIQASATQLLLIGCADHVWHSTAADWLCWSHVALNCR